MPRFSANLSLLFTEVPLQERFQKAASCGFSTIEIQFPYELSVEEISNQLQEHKLSLDLINFPAGDWQAGDRGIACDPARIEEFEKGVDQAIEYAKALGCPQINCLAGIPPSAVSLEQALQTLERNLCFADQKLAEQGIRLNIEAINNQDIPGFFLHYSDQVIDLINRLDLQNSYLQFDAYHMQIMEGDMLESLQKHLPQIGHIQIADYPGRHQPGTGQIDFPRLFKALDQLGYTGWVALEYNPLVDTESSLSWIDTE